MKKLLLILLLSFCTIFACACTGQIEAVATQALGEPVPVVCNEITTIAAPKADTGKVAPSAPYSAATVTAVVPEAEERVLASAPPAAIENASSVVWKAEERRYETLEAKTVQEQAAIAAAAPQAAPAALKSSVSWNPAPRQETATPMPKISVDFVITCPPEPTPTPTAPTPIETPAAQPSTEPVAPEVPQTPAPEQPFVPEPAPDPAPPPTPEPGATQKPSGGYAVCSCGATILPDELVAHMKAHALKCENHSYVAY